MQELLRTSDTVVTRLPRVWPRLATADETAVAAELPVLEAALLAALVPARPCSIGPVTQTLHLLSKAAEVCSATGRHA